LAAALVAGEPALGAVVVVVVVASVPSMAATASTPAQTFFRRIVPVRILFPGWHYGTPLAKETSVIRLSVVRAGSRRNVENQKYQSLVTVH
jgi:hypothetical protein